jgi:hypothetical protein
MNAFNRQIHGGMHYLLKFEQSYLKFRFALYNNGENWTITGLKCEEDADDLL